jgi:hypothetical protein
MGFAEITKTKVTERHGTASVAGEERRAVLPPQTREAHMPWHHDTRRSTMAEHNAVVGIYTTHTEAEAAVKALQKAGFDLQKLSIMGKDAHTEEHVVGYYNGSSPPILEKGEHFPRVIGIHALLCSHYKHNL